MIVNNNIEHDKTMQGLMCWSKHLIEKFGWMMIMSDKMANPDENSKLIKDTISLYKDHITQIIKDLDNKQQHLVEVDRKNEILIVHAQMKHLKKIVDQSFGKNETNMAGGAKPYKKSSKKSSKKSTNKSSKKSSKKSTKK